ncbi:hypothetical protein V494_06006, partial [Pseudogymnoascus sp. VKM F-4513 (FW-928)]
MDTNQVQGRDEGQGGIGLVCYSGAFRPSFALTVPWIPYYITAWWLDVDSGASTSTPTYWTHSILQFALELCNVGKADGPWPVQPWPLHPVIVSVTIKSHLTPFCVLLPPHFLHPRTPPPFPPAHPALCIICTRRRAARCARRDSIHTLLDGTGAAGVAACAVRDWGAGGGSMGVGCGDIWGCAVGVEGVA